MTWGCQKNKVFWSKTLTLKQVLFKYHKNLSKEMKRVSILLFVCRYSSGRFINTKGNDELDCTKTKLSPKTQIVIFRSPCTHSTYVHKAFANSLAVRKILMQMDRCEYDLVWPPTNEQNPWYSNSPLSKSFHSFHTAEPTHAPSSVFDLQENYDTACQFESHPQWQWWQWWWWPLLASSQEDFVFFALISSSIFDFS